jgi:uroporphyrinogen III methyltransferase/synthase
VTWRIVSRASRLALVQVDEALDALAPFYPSGTDRSSFKLKILESFGDKNKSLDLLAGSSPADLFTRELDEELRAGRADFAVHSAKDLPIPLPPDLAVVGLLPPADQTDSLACRAGLGPSLADLPPGARVGTSSPLRRKELEALRPDLTVAGIRGTIEERLAQVDRGAYDAVIVATCALHRLGLGHRIGQVLPFATHPLQGRLAVTALRSRSDVLRLWAPADERRGWGRVYLVGAGPGDPELLTLKAHRLLRQADVIFNDSLANPSILDGLDAEVRFVGKRGDAGGELQDRINETLYQAAVAGKTVVRLKGGDPMLFGRAVEEMEYLEQRLVDVEIVPGVSSAQAASAYTQIPLTERQVSSSVSYCLGHPADRIPVPNSDTLVYYMSSASLATIVAKVLEAGRDPATPVALVRNASLPDQQVWLKTLGGLAEELAARPDHPYASPLLTIVGPVARPERVANWYEVLPRVWYTGTNVDHYTRPCRLTHRPLVAIQPLDDPRALEERLRHLAGFSWAVFTSRHTVAAVFGRLQALGLDARAFVGVRVAAVGRATAADLASRGLRADLVASPESSEGLVEAFTAAPSLLTPKARVFLPCSDQASPTIERGLTALGAVVDKVVAYRNVAVDTPPAGVDPALLDEVVLTSPSTARAFARWFPSPPDRLVLVPIGAATARALNDLFPGRPLGDPLLDPSPTEAP